MRILFLFTRRLRREQMRCGFRGGGRNDFLDPWLQYSVMWTG